MCGLILITGDAPTGLVEHLCEAVGARGPHSHGWAWTVESAWNVERVGGPLSPPPPGPWRMALGHSRLATSGAHGGDLPSPEDGQPIDLGPLLVAHNGTLKQYTGGNKSDTVLALREARTLEDIPTALTPHDDAPQAALAVNKATLEVLAWRTGRRGGHPLFVTETGTYRILSSIPTTGSQLLPTGTTHYPYTQPSPHPKPLNP